ncbi:MAG: OmpP1/FadL family transporter [Pseudomonadota bacterium]
MRSSKRLLALAVSAAITAPMSAHATNGMNLEAYGPVAGGMGGASMAYDNGTAAMMNNTATLGLMEEGSRLDVALGNMRPDVSTESEMMNTKWDSSSDSFMMPALGWVKKSGKMSYGVGMFSQGGMGTEYSGDTSPGGSFSAGWMTSPATAFDPGAQAPSPCDVVSGGNPGDCNPANLSGTGLDTGAVDAMALTERSEVGVGRLIAPFSYDVNEQLIVGGSIDYVWAGMDLQMAMNGMMMGDMMMNPQSSYGSISGELVDTVDGMMANNGGPIYGLNYGYFDFTNDNDFTGEAKGDGFAGKIGATFKVNRQLTIGATYHSETSMSDLDASGAKVSMSVLYDTGSGLQAMPVDMVGNIKVKDFQWPATMAVGMAYQANDRLMVAADVKRINWSDVMSDFTMVFTPKSASMGGNDVTAQFAGKEMEAVLYQDWEDQTVAQLGVSYMVNNATTVRAGYNYASNPVPDDKLNYLFPAITEKHYTLGVGHAFTRADSVDFAISYVPEVTGGGENGFETSMSQMNWQMMYSHKF